MMNNAVNHGVFLGTVQLSGKVDIPACATCNDGRKTDRTTSGVEHWHLKRRYAAHINVTHLLTSDSLIISQSGFMIV